MSDTDIADETSEATWIIRLMEHHLETSKQIASIMALIHGLQLQMDRITTQLERSQHIYGVDKFAQPTSERPKLHLVQFNAADGKGDENA